MTFFQAFMYLTSNTPRLLLVRVRLNTEIMNMHILECSVQTQLQK